MESISCAPFLSMEIWFWRLMVGWFGIFIYEISVNFYDWQRVGRRKNKYSRVKKIHSSFIFRINFQPQYLFSNSFLFNYQIHFFSPARFDQFFKDSSHFFLFYIFRNTDYIVYSFSEPISIDPSWWFMEPACEQIFPTRKKISRNPLNK